MYYFKEVFFEVLYSLGKNNEKIPKIWLKIVKYAVNLIFMKLISVAYLYLQK